MNASAQSLISEHNWEEGTALAHSQAKGKCEYCDDDMLKTWKSYLAMQIDHLLPKSIYDDHRYNFRNYVSCCSTCNHLKGKFDPLLEGENPALMLEKARAELIDRVKDHLQKKTEIRESEFASVKAIIQSD